MATETGTAMATETETATGTAMAMATETGTAMAMAMATAMATATATATRIQDLRSYAAKCLRRCRIALPLPMILLTACVPTTSEVCPQIVDYSSEFRNRAADEIERLPDDSPVIKMFSDYRVMRNQARICREYLSGEL